MKPPCSKCSGTAPLRLQPPAISGSTASRTNCNPTTKPPSKSSQAASSCPQPNGRSSKPACANISSRWPKPTSSPASPHTLSVADYVCVHELAHLRHPNHSPAFWAAVEQHTQHRAAATAWLKQHGRELFLLG